MKSKLEKKIDKGQKLNRQEEVLKNNIDAGNFGDPYETPVRIAEAQLGEYKEYDKLDVDGNQVRDYTGMAIMNPAVEFAEGTYNLVGMNNGDIQVGINALDGSIDAGDGSVHIDANGINIITKNGYYSGEKIRFYNDTIANDNLISQQTSTYDSAFNDGTAKTRWQTKHTYGKIEQVQIVAGNDSAIYPVPPHAIISMLVNKSTDSASITETSDIHNISASNYINLDAGYSTSPGYHLVSIPADGGLRIYPDRYDLTITQGTLKWNSDRDTLDLTQTGTTLQLGQEIHYYVINQTGADIADGTAVMFAGSLGASGILKITKAVADGTYPAIYMMGVTTQAIANGATGKVTFFGEVRGINTSAYSDGDILYLDPATPGGLTKTQPTAPNLKYAMAAVVSAGNNGTIFVRAIYSQALSELNDVKITTPASGEVMKYDGTKWVNSTVTTGATTLDALTDVTITSVATNDILTYTGSQWENKPATASTATNSRYLLQAASECWSKTDGSYISTAIASGTINNAPGIANHPGVIKISSIAATNTGGVFSLPAVDNIILGGVEEWQVIVSPQQSNSNVTGLIGFMDSYGASVTPNNALCVKFTGNGTNIDLAFLSRVAGAGSATNFTTLTAGTWYRIKLTNGGAGAVNVYVYDTSGTQLATYNFTGSLPTAAMGFGVKAYRINSSASDLIFIDRVDLYSTNSYTR